MQREFGGSNADLGDVGRRFREWRERHGGRGRRLPDELWREAARLARSGDVARVAKVLRLRPEALRRRLGRGDRGSEGRAGGRHFVEITPVADASAGRRIGAAGGGCSVEVSGRGGRTVSLHFVDLDGVDLVALTRQLLEDGA